MRLALKVKKKSVKITEIYVASVLIHWQHLVGSSFISLKKHLVSSITPILPTSQVFTKLNESLRILLMDKLIKLRISDFYTS